MLNLAYGEQEVSQISCKLLTTGKLEWEHTRQLTTQLAVFVR